MMAREKTSDWMSMLKMVHERIGEAYVYTRGACAALEYAIQDYRETLRFLEARKEKARRAGEEARARAARLEQQRAARASGVDDKRLREVLMLARRAREACAIVDARGTRAGNQRKEKVDESAAVLDTDAKDIEEEEEEEEEEPQVEVPSPLRLPQEVSRKLRAYDASFKRHVSASNLSNAAQKRFVDALKSRRRASHRDVSDDKVQSWARTAATVQALCTAKEVLDEFDFSSNNQRETALVLAHVSRILRTCKSMLLLQQQQARERTEYRRPNASASMSANEEEEEDNEELGWTWRDECLRTFATVGAQESHYPGSSHQHGRGQIGCASTSAVRGIADCWVPPKALAMCEPLVMGTWTGDVRMALQHRQRGGMEALDASIARHEVMATLLQLHIESDVVPVILNSMRPATLAHARLASWFITGKRRYLKVLRTVTETQ